MERALRAAGFGLVAGVDEVGRGPLAGPVAAAAVILDGEPALLGLDDSKKLTPGQRSRVFPAIIRSSLAVGFALVGQEFVDRHGIAAATAEAMRRALMSMPLNPDVVLVDGRYVPELRDFYQISILGGDGLCNCIAAASVVAKVIRDEYMRECSEAYPQYGFDKHKGYGTPGHLEALRRYGPCPLHRKTFIRRLPVSGVAATEG